jgi:hypothetical protein
MHLGVWMQLYYIVITYMSRPVSAIHVVIYRVVFSPREWPKHVVDYYVIKLHSYTQVHLLIFFFKKKFTSDLCMEHGTYKSEYTYFIFNEGFSRVDIHYGFCTTDHDSQLWLYFKTRKNSADLEKVKSRS